MMRGDPTFQQALKVKRGTLRIPAILEPLAQRVRERYGERPLWIAGDTIPVPGSRREVRPRLHVVFERTAQFKQFESAPYAFDAERQATVALDFSKLVPAAAQARLFRSRFRQTVSSDLFVCFSDFEPAALEDAHMSVSVDDINGLAHRHFGDDFWEASRLFAGPVIFLHTDAQVATYKDSPILAAVDDAYRDLVASHDEFGYFDRRATFVPLDSKENFDKKYASNWYYYWK